LDGARRVASAEVGTPDQQRTAYLSKSFSNAPFAARFLLPLHPGPQFSGISLHHFFDAGMNMIEADIYIAYRKQ
jgi:hypothetical protein